MKNVLSGFQSPNAGLVIVGDHDASGRAAHWFARQGVIRTFQTVRLFLKRQREH
jgi:branched-chain amino acid transport system ATP-binding protein